MEENRVQLSNFAHNITCIRKHYGISKKRMAQLLGIRIASLSRLELGQIPSGMTVLVLLRAFRQFRFAPSDLLEKRLRSGVFWKWRTPNSQFYFLFTGKRSCLTKGKKASAVIPMGIVYLPGIKVITLFIGEYNATVGRGLAPAAQQAARIR